jgi:hypothetical protein
MAILVDTPIWPFRGRLWCHLVSDTSYESCTCWPRRWASAARFQGDHYDLPEEMRDAAIAPRGAAVSGRELITRLRASGLRRPHRH